MITEMERPIRHVPISILLVGQQPYSIPDATTYRSWAWHTVYVPSIIQDVNLLRLTHLPSGLEGGNVCRPLDARRVIDAFWDIYDSWDELTFERYQKIHYSIKRIMISTVQMFVAEGILFRTNGPTFLTNTKEEQQ